MKKLQEVILPKAGKEDTLIQIEDLGNAFNPTTRNPLEVMSDKIKEDFKYLDGLFTNEFNDNSLKIAILKNLENPGIRLYAIMLSLVSSHDNSINTLLLELSIPEAVSIDDIKTEIMLILLTKDIGLLSVQSELFTKIMSLLFAVGFSPLRIFIKTYS